MVSLSIAKGKFGFSIGIDGLPVGRVFTLEREANGVVRPVAGAQELKSTGNTMFVKDYTALQNVTVAYRLRMFARPEELYTEWVDAPDYLNFGGDVLFSAPQPERRMVATVESFPQQEHGIEQNIVKVLGRRDPIVVSNARQYPNGTLNLLTLTDEDRRTLVDMFRTTDVLGFSPHQPDWGFDKVHYYAIGRVTETRPSPRPWEPARRWSLEVQQVEPVRPELSIITPFDPITPPDPTGPVDPAGDNEWINWVERRWVELTAIDWAKVAGV